MQTSGSGSVLALILCCALFSCAPTGPYIWVSDLPQQQPTKGLRVGDRIQVIVYGQDAISGEFEIRPGGELVGPLGTRVMAVGSTLEAVNVELTSRLRGLIAEPRIAVILSSRRPIGVSVVGEVKTPGRYDLRDGDGVLDALARAGSLSTFADQDAIYVIRRQQKSARIRFKYSMLVQADLPSIRFELEEGDIVVAE